MGGPNPARDLTLDHLEYWTRQKLVWFRLPGSRELVNTRSCVNVQGHEKKSLFRVVRPIRGLWVGIVLQS